MNRLHFALLAALCAALAACGGGGSSSPSATIPPVATNPVPTPVAVVTLAVLPDARGLYADASGAFPSDAEAGIFPNSSGAVRSFSTSGRIDTENPFFKPFGNGRSCASCHRQEDGFSVSTRGLQVLFDKTGGTDPVFQLLDGANSPSAPATTLEQKRAAYSLLLSRGLFRIGLKIPAGAEFELVSVDDPYNYASASELSLYRRPLPSANLKFVSDIMWDGRETQADSSSTHCVPGTRLCFAPLDANLGRQANHATRGHAQAQADLTEAEQLAIVAFEKTLFSAQQVDAKAGLLFGADGTGGALALSRMEWAIGLNDRFGSGLFDEQVFKLFDSWIVTTAAPAPAATRARQSITRGQDIFNNHQFAMTGVSGLNDQVGINNRAVTCSSCHSVPGVGNLSRPLSFNLGLADASLRSASLPLYTLRNKKTGAIVHTMDPGQAMTTGLWEHIGRFKAPVLRGLAARAPYFHDGSAGSIEEVTNFYNTTFNMGLTVREMEDLSAFLKAL